jgi:UDP-N-acetyl-D-mannosaminuronic acid dehydrogenase
VTKICVLGLGYIGLPSASMFATQGHEVIGVDVNREIVKTLMAGQVQIREPGLDVLVHSATQSGNLRVSTEVEPAEVFIIAVPTPLAPSLSTSDPPLPDLSYVSAAAEAVADHLRAGNLVILESTSPPGTTQGLVRTRLESTGLKAGRDFSLAYCAERVLPGRILVELVTNDRIVGGIDQASAVQAKDLYASFVQGRIFTTTATTAEFIKLMENTYRDVNIALANEFSGIAQHVGVDVHEAIELANRHPRVNVLRPGPGVGGHCIAVDPWFLVDAAPAITSLVRTARQVNDAQPCRVADWVSSCVADLDHPTIAALGMSYKADVDDMRESPSIDVVRILIQRGYKVSIHDVLAQGYVEDIPIEQDLSSAIQGADVMIVLTDHTLYRELEPTNPFLVGIRRKRLLDTRGCLNRKLWRSHGFSVQVMGDGGNSSHHNQK